MTVQEAKVNIENLEKHFRNAKRGTALYEVLGVFVTLEDLRIAIQALEEVEQYRALGTVEELKEAREKQPKADWIPCEERLPSESNYYMACIYNADVDDFDFRKTWFAHKNDYDMEDSEWRELYEFETVTAWQNLPQPYKKEGESNASA